MPTRPSTPVKVSFLALTGAFVGAALLVFIALATYRSHPDAQLQVELAMLGALTLALLALIPLLRLRATLHKALNSAQPPTPRRKTDSALAASDGQRMTAATADALIGPLSETNVDVSDSTRRMLPAMRLPPDTQANLLRDIIDQIPYPVFALDSSDQVLFVNAALASLYGTTPQKLAQSKASGHLRRLCSDDLLTRPSGNNVEGEEWLTTIEGEERRYLVQRLPFHSQIEGELVVAIDVTELHKLQLQLQFSQRLEVLGTLAGGIAHDFNNLLTPILGYSSILLDSDLSTDHHDKVRAIATAADRARKVAQQMLSFSRQNDDAEFKDQIDLAEVIQEAVAFMRASVPPSIDIQLDLQATPQIRADSGQIHQVMVNLCTNASQAIEAPSGLVTVRCSEVTAGSSKLPALLSHCHCALIEVIDNGTGMSPAVMNHVFEPFFTTKEVGEGSGLGLSIVQGIVSRHGGKVTVTSDRQLGTCFSVFLPIAHAATFEPNVALKEPRLLLVDDDDMVLRVLEDLLNTKGYSVTACSDPKRALSHLAAAPEQVDVLITDNNMPKLKGVDLARAAREINPRLPIILITGFAKPTEAELVNINRNLMKPVSSKDLTDAIREVSAAIQAA